MPQLDVSTYLPQLVWLAITFVALYVLMSRLALPPVGAALERRRAKIEGDLERAQRLKSEAETVMAAYEQSLAEARRNAQETLRQGAEKLSAEAAERLRETSRALQEEAAAAERAIASARSAALADLKSAASDVARDLARKLGAEIEAADAVAVVEHVLRERA